MCRSRLDEALGRRRAGRHAGQAERWLGFVQVRPIDAIDQHRPGEYKAAQKVGDQAFGDFDLQRQQAAQRRSLEDHHLLVFLLGRRHARPTDQADRLVGNAAHLGCQQGPAERPPQLGTHRAVMELLPFQHAAERCNLTSRQGRQDALR